jgi:hypothetical protein
MYFDFHTNYSMPNNSTHCQKETEPKDGSRNWPMSSLLENYNRVPKVNYEIKTFLAHSGPF